MEDKGKALASEVREHIAKWRALREFVRGVFGRNNLIGSDFEDIKATRIKRKFEQGTGGIRVSFSISYHALGKLSGEVQDAKQLLLGEPVEGV